MCCVNSVLLSCSALTPELPVRNPLFVRDELGKGAFGGSFETHNDLVIDSSCNHILERKIFAKSYFGKVIFYYYLGGYLVVSDESEAVQTSSLTVYCRN